MVQDAIAEGPSPKNKPLEVGITTKAHLNELRYQAERQGVESLTKEECADLNVDIQKTTFMGGVGSAFSKVGEVAGTALSVAGTVIDSPAQLAKWGTEKVTGSETAGDVAKWITRAALVAGAAYLGVGLLREGAEAAYGGGEILLDRIGVGAGQLFPAMEMPAAPASLQTLPGADILQGF